LNWHEPSLAVQTPTMTYRLVLVRHGQSEWNLANLFTGWYDADITELGADEARQGGRDLLAAGIMPDGVHTPLQQRAIRTLPLRPARPRREVPALPTGPAVVEVERAALRRAAGVGQGEDARGVRRGEVHALAPQLRHPAAAARLGRRAARALRPALRRHAARTA